MSFEEQFPSLRAVKLNEGELELAKIMERHCLDRAVVIKWIDERLNWLRTFIETSKKMGDIKQVEILTGRKLELLAFKKEVLGTK